MFITNIHQREVYHVFTQPLSHFSSEAALSRDPQRSDNANTFIWEAQLSVQFLVTPPLVSYRLNFHP